MFAGKKFLVLSCHLLQDHLRQVGGQLVGNYPPGERDDLDEENGLLSDGQIANGRPMA